MDDLSPLKVPPHSIEAERSVLGGLMLDDNAWDNISGTLAAEDFYRSDHRIIYRVMADLVERNNPLDIITISEALEGIGELENVGGLAYISDLASSTPTASNIHAYAQIVRERSTVRSLISVAHEIADSGFNPDGRNSATLIDEAESKVFKISDDRPSSGGPESVRPLLTRAVERIDVLFQTKGALTGISSGFRDIDEMTSGLQPADLVIVAGRPSMGKTSFMMNIAESAAISGESPVLVFSMEMPSDSLVLRMLSSLGRIDQTKIRTGQLGDDDWPRLTSAVTLLNDKPLFIDDTAALSPNEIRSRARRVAREHGKLGMILLDYIQLMQVSGTSENRAGEISEISRSLKSIAKEFDCPVIAGSQLNRSLEQRPDKRPIMSDLRESGAIEQDADVIMAIYRDEVYHEDAEKGIAEIIILKQRNGPIGRKKLAFVGQYTKFEDLAVGYDDYY
ncbi:MAG: replicative DNA helicase [Gammaproteobacteria bacterium]|nr:replicative DNA helicase [Gammaproteobacteria bacterium]MBT3868208.1 replicative DNA helicase [Gammaproteobacteria bacterium]MBT5200142.1 replicative DNA helicase [Gammaproteobacteria bacterium]MBT5443597.1 replicative DNA helicase [Gammaproteobacteria bacterium]MBT5789225.1 replicative DNA helicase [Gammaproteobacteria bacterium]